MQFIVFALKMARCTALEAIVRIDDDNGDVGGKGGVGKRRAAQTRYRRQTDQGIGYCGELDSEPRTTAMHCDAIILWTETNNIQNCVEI